MECWIRVLIEVTHFSFHEKVHESLGQRRADVIELYQPLSPLMASVQGAIIECMEATLAELRRSNTTASITCSFPQQG